MDIIAVWLINIVFFLSAGLRYVLCVSHKLILFMLSPSLSVTHNIRLHFIS